MTGLFIALGIVLLCLIALKFGARLAWRDMSAPAAALLLGLAGYAWQGHPGLIGHPVTQTAAAKFDERLAEKRRAIGERVGPAAKWLVMSDALARQGNTQDAANILVAGLRATPNDPDLWVGLGNALIAHSGGTLSPASNFAFLRAMALAPQAVSPHYFYGLAMAQSGQLEQGKALWSELAGRLPPQSDLHAELERNLMLIDQLIAQRDAARSTAGGATQ